MYLTNEQLERYQSTMGSLLAYTDERLGITQELPPAEADRLMDERMALIARELWRNLSMAASFADDNPDGLPALYQETARQWTGGLSGRCIVTGFDEQGDAIVEHLAGTFVVRGISQEPSCVFGETPIAFNTALLPFDGGIVFGCPIGFAERVDGNEVTWTQDRAREAGFAGVLASAADLARRADAYRERCVSEELAQLEAEKARNGLVVAPGYHRSALAGMGPEERRRAQDRWLASCPDSPFAGMLDVCDDDALGNVLGGDDVYPSAAELEIVRLAGACAMVYGIVSLLDAYDQYVALSDRPLSRARFEETVLEWEGFAVYGYSVWIHDDVSYVIAISLSELGAFHTALGRLEARLADKAQETEHDMRTEFDLVLDDESLDELDRWTDEERDRLSTCCVSLLDAQADAPRRPIERRMVEEGVVPYLLQLAPMRALREFMDNHVPDDEDDYLFVDGVLANIVGSFIAYGSGVNDAYALLGRYHMMQCEGSDWSDTLGRMVVNVFNTVPRWRLNGWSLAQRTERITGRRAFYAPDGSVMKVGRNDRCPCGSGKKYGWCCGR